LLTDKPHDPEVVSESFYLKYILLKKGRNECHVAWEQKKFPMVPMPLLFDWHQMHASKVPCRRDI
jgi:hypothetical protein